MGAQWKQKHRQIAADSKGRRFNKLAKEVAIAARDGADPDMNARLRMAMEAARKASMPRDTLERAIKKGAGLLGDSVQYEQVTYEGFAPHQVPVVVECLTENNNRTATNVRVLFDKGGGQLAGQGSITWDFDRLGAIEAAHDGGVDAEEEAIEAGAQDVESDEDGTTFLTDATDLDVVRKALEARGWTVSSAALIWKSRNPVTLDEGAAGAVEAFLEALDADDDVQHIFVGLA